MGREIMTEIYQRWGGGGRYVQTVTTDKLMDKEKRDKK